MIRFVAWGVLTVSALLAGCAAVPPQPPIALTADWAGTAKGGRIGVVVSAVPKPDTSFPGAGCLLCIGVASAANSSMTAHVRTLDTDEFKPLKTELVALLQAHGLEAVAIEEPLKLADLPDLKTTETLNRSRKDFGAFKARHGVARLLVVDFQSVGVTRAYSAYVATDVPRAAVDGTAFVVELESHRLEWLQPLSVRRAAEGGWDEPPKFPGLTNAYYQAIAQALDQIRQPFAR